MKLDGETQELMVQVPGERVDRYVAEEIPSLSRTAVQRLIEAESITVNGEAVQAAYRLRQGDQITVHVPPPQPLAIEPEAIPLDILYEDCDLLAVNKAAGMVVHPAAGHRSGTLVNAILAHCPDLQGVGGKLRPGIVHRLDKDTSGVIVVAKNDQALRALQRQFKRRTVEKHYTALVIGDVPQKEGVIEAPVARHPRHRKRMAVRSGGKAARTRWQVMERYWDEHRRLYTLLDVKLLTGRTHQIRVHLSWMGYPLAGDAVYGPPRAATSAPRQFLHARVLAIRHPVTTERLCFEAPLPADLQRVLDSLTLVDADGN